MISKRRTSSRCSKCWRSRERFETRRWKKHGSPAEAGRPGPAGALRSHRPRYARSASGHGDYNVGGCFAGSVPCQGVLHAARQRQARGHAARAQALRRVPALAARPAYQALHDPRASLRVRRVRGAGRSPVATDRSGTRQEMIDGALLLDKPVGLSSNAALQEAKRLLGAKKAGHGGTLDPLASGLLVILFGEATKFAGPMLEADKEYLASVKLGERTDTGDAEGAVLETRSVSVSAEEVEKALGRFHGEI